MHEQRSKAELLRELSALRKRVAKLGRAEEAYHTLVDQSLQGLAIFQEGRVVFVNQAMADITGYTVEEILAMSAEEVEAFVHPEDRELVWSRYRDRLNGKAVPSRYELRGIRKDGSTCWLEIHGRRIEYKGKPAIQTAYMDVTERRKAEDALKESEAKWRSLVANAPDIIMIVGRDGAIQFINHTVPGMSPSEVVGRSLYDYLPPEHQQTQKKLLERVFQTGKAETYEVAGSGPHGAPAWYSSRIAPFKHNEKVTAAIIITRDITKHKKAQEALEKSEKDLREIFENTIVGVYRTTPDGRILMANPALVRMLGYSCFEELSQRNLEKEGYEPAYLRSVFLEHIEKDGQVVGLESVWTRSDGTRLVVIENARAVRGEDGRTLYYEGTVEDITERSRAEEALRRSEDTARAFFNAITDTAVLLDTECTILAMNKAGAARLGKDVGEIVGQNAGDLFRPEVFELRRSMAAEALRLGKTVRYEDERDGRYFDTCLCPVFDGQGRVDRLAVFARDISDRKKTEQSLRETEERLRVALSAAQMGTWRWDPATNQDTRDASLNLILGLEAVESTQPVEDFLQFVHPEDRDMADEEIQRAIRERRTYVAEFRIIRPDGTVRWLHDQGEPVCDEKGRVLFLTGAVVDITNRKRAEIQLRESEERFRMIAETSLDYIFQTDADGVMLYCSPAVERILGYTPEERVGQHFSQILVPSELPKARAEFKKVMEGQAVQNAEFSVRHKKGKMVIVDANVVPVVRNGQVTGTLGVVRDISKAKKMERALRESERELSIHNEIASVFLTVSDDEMYGEVLQIVLEALESKYGVFGYIDEDGAMVCPSMTRGVWDQCQMADKQIVFPRERWGGLWGRALTEKRALYSNGPLHVPKGHIRISRALAAPIIHQGQVVGILLAGNRVTDYDEQDKKLLERIAAHVAPILNTRLQRDRYERERLRAEKSLRQSEEDYRTVVEAASDAIFTLDKNNVFLFMNKVGGERLGGKPEDFVGKTMWELFPKEYADRQAANVREVIRTGRGTRTTALTQLQGELRWYNTTVEPLRDSAGKVTSAMVIARDVHATKQAEEELNKYRGKMVRAEQLASLGAVGANVAHELATPLMAVNLSIENSLADLQAAHGPDAVIEQLEDARTEVSKVNLLVDRFRNLARKSSEKTVSKVDLKAIAERIAKLLDKTAQQAKINVCLEGLDGLPPVYFSERDVEQIFFALVRNAIQAAEGKRNGRLSISGSVKDQRVELRFADNCRGIPAKNLDKVFEPFFTTKPASEGTGLGLCIVRRIASEAGGKVRVESKLGKGSTFFVTLPTDTRGRP